MSSSLRDESELLAPNDDGTFRLTAKGHAVMWAALKSSVKFIGYIKRPPISTHSDG
jgi:hypothetical protein